MNSLELLAPARNTDIGISAIGCGADAVYIAGPEFGARKDAGNSVEDIKRLCDYAHQFGARVFVTLNTILTDEQIPAAQKLLTAVEDAGADAFIVQDLGILKFKTRVPLHASTQCSIRTPERAQFLQSLGFARVVLERQTSLDQIKAIRDSINTEIEYFVHGALCVCYSGQCYLSESIDRRSANRGACIQACRSLYDLVDESGKVLLKNKAILSLKDYNLINRIGDLAEAGVASFKIEGRLKNISYVKNVVRAYSIALDKFIAEHQDKYQRASFGRVHGGFTPEIDKTFNRGYTELFIDGKRGQWSSMTAPKSMGEEIGIVRNIQRDRSGISINVTFAKKDITLKNGDGFAFVSNNTIIGFRGDVCQGSNIKCKDVSGIKSGVKIFRNISADFEKRLDSDMPKRMIGIQCTVSITGKENDYTLVIRSYSEDGRDIALSSHLDCEKAGNEQRMKDLLKAQISKNTGLYEFSLSSLEIITEDGSIPFMSSAAINEFRRQIANEMDERGCEKIHLLEGNIDDSIKAPDAISYKENVSNHLAKEVYSERGSKQIEQAYELTHIKGAELMRMKYCIKHELGLCPKLSRQKTGNLYLINNGRKFALGFDCASCEMTLKEC